MQWEMVWVNIPLYSMLLLLHRGRGFLFIKKEIHVQMSKLFPSRNFQHSIHLRTSSRRPLSISSSTDTDIAQNRTHFSEKDIKQRIYNIFSSPAAFHWRSLPYFRINLETRISLPKNHPHIRINITFPCTRPFFIISAATAESCP